MNAWPLWAQSTPAMEPVGLEWWRMLLALVFVAALLGALVVLARRGAFGALTRSRQAAITVDAVVPLGERRSLMIVSVEGRRLLLGASPVNVSLVAELGPRQAFESALSRSVAAHQEPLR